MKKRKRKEKRQPLATLSESELSEINKRQELIDDAAQRVRMMVDGQQVVWARLRTKYQITEDFDFDPVTGKMFPKVAAGNKALKLAGSG